MEKPMEMFFGKERICIMTICKLLVRVFSEQFVGTDGKAELKVHPGGNIMLNPSDPDAKNAHKVPGCQVQVAETFSDENESQLIPAAIPQYAGVSDMDSETLVQEKLKPENFLQKNCIPMTVAVRTTTS